MDFGPLLTPADLARSLQVLENRNHVLVCLVHEPVLYLLFDEENFKSKRQWLFLLAVEPFDGPAKLVGVPEVEVEGRDPQVFTHHARHVH